MSNLGNGYTGYPQLILSAPSPPMQQPVPSPPPGNAQYMYPMPGGFVKAIGGSNSRQQGLAGSHPGQSSAPNTSTSRSQGGTQVQGKSVDSEKRNRRLRLAYLSVLTTYEYSATTCHHEKEDYTVGKDPDRRSDPDQLAQELAVIDKKLTNRNPKQVLWMNLDGRSTEVLKHVLDRAMGDNYADVPEKSILLSKQRVSCIVLHKTLFLLAKIPQLKADYDTEDKKDKNKTEITLAEKKKALIERKERAKANIQRMLAGVKKQKKNAKAQLNKRGKQQVEGDDDTLEDHIILDYERIGFLVNSETNTLITVQGGDEGDVWDDLREELDHTKSKQPLDNTKLEQGRKTRSRPVIYLYFRLLKMAIESCETIDKTFDAMLKVLSDNSEEAEDAQSLVDEEDTQAARQIHHEMIAFRRRVVPLRDAFRDMADPKFAPNIITPEYLPFFEDLHHFALRIMDNMERHHDNSADLQQKYVELDNQRNAKIQFIISMALVFFSPLSFITGLYGMNFAGDPETGTGGMPELTWKDGYTYVWYLIMAVILAIIVAFAFLGIIPGCGWLHMLMRPKNKNKSFTGSSSRHTDNLRNQIGSTGLAMQVR